MNPQRIVLILPCCIGDVVLATATLKALRRRFPSAHLTWAVGTWSKSVLEGHPLLDALWDTGAAALPVKSAAGFVRFVRGLRQGRYDLAVSLVRSPLMSAAVWLAGIPQRAGLDSGGRGFGYNLRVPVDPLQPRHEAEIYLDVARALGADTADCHANLPVSGAARTAVAAQLAQAGVQPPYIVLHPGGGQNPGMTLDLKRWPPQHFAALADRLAGLGSVVLLGSAADADLVAAVAAQMRVPAVRMDGRLSIPQAAALAQGARLYVGNDTGLTHVAAAAGAKTVMILGPSDPARYAPFAPDARALWKPGAVQVGGVVAGVPAGWTWAKDGLSVDEAEAGIRAFLG